MSADCGAQRRDCMAHQERAEKPQEMGIEEPRLSLGEAARWREQQVRRHRYQ